MIDVLLLVDSPDQQVIDTISNLFLLITGTAVITENEAALWTDGRYFLQADKQLDSSCWKLMKQGISSTPTITGWLSSVHFIVSKHVSCLFYNYHDLLLNCLGIGKGCQSGS